MGRTIGVELGGTSVRVALAVDDPKNITKQISIPTTTPDETLTNITKFLDENQPFESLGIASFGPVDLKEGSNTYGYITSTPKPNWAMTDVVGRFKKYKVPIFFDTDVNAPAFTELKYGTHGNVSSLAYITVGTGVGVGAVVNGKTVVGAMHMEGGHIYVPKAPGDDYEGKCVYHKCCVEGMVASHALAARKDGDITKLPSYPNDDKIWDIAAWYLAQLCLSITLLLSPECIVISGGIMQRSCLFPKVREIFKTILAGYVSIDKIVNHLDEYIVPSTFGNNIGIISACALGMGQEKN